MKMKLNTVLSLSLFVGLSPFMFGQMENKSYLTSNCASGGFDYYFYNSHIVIAECIGCERRPYVQSGNWTIKNGEVHIQMDQEWYGEGTGAVVAAANVSIYENYIARYGTTDSYLTLPLAVFQSSVIDGCEEVGNHSYSDSSPNVFLRNEFVGKYPECSSRFLTDSDLMDKTKQELRIMRNEIFARYGYRFKSNDLKTYFEGQKNYVEFGSDVDAFLSDIEKKNIALIKIYENKN